MVIQKNKKIVIILKFLNIYLSIGGIYMEISKENIFKKNYTSIWSGYKTKRKNRTSKIINFIKKNKIISIIAITFFTCLTLNLVLIYNFMKILGSV